MLLCSLAHAAPRVALSGVPICTGAHSRGGGVRVAAVLCPPAGLGLPRLGPLAPPGVGPCSSAAHHTPFGGGGVPLCPPPCPSGSVDCVCARVCAHTPRESIPIMLIATSKSQISACACVCESQLDSKKTIAVATTHCASTALFTVDQFLVSVFLHMWPSMDGPTAPCIPAAHAPSLWGPSVGQAHN